ncbi:MAG: threonine synthase [Planctomycetales bacterium]|nr:threonine synthase [Planctomycetales bacterium]
MATRWVTGLESAWDGTWLDPNQPHQMHVDRPLWVRYDLEAVGRVVRRQDLASRPWSMWRYRELLPMGLDEEVVSLGEGVTPLLTCERLGGRLGLERLLIKDESVMPTGSFKARGQAMAMTMARRFGTRCVALPTAGNAGGAAAAYAARAGLRCVVFMPRDTPIVNRLEAMAYGAEVFLVNGLINDCGRLVREGQARYGWFDLSTLKEPYRIEGKKTMGLELAEQLRWWLPDVIVYPTGGGTGLIGMAKAFEELRALGWLESDRMPRFISVQSEGCAPIAKAFARGERLAEVFPNAHTIASGLRVPVAVGDFMILDAVRASGGLAVSVPETSIRERMFQAMSLEGISICPETAACLEACATLRNEGGLSSDEQVVVFNTGAAQKYVEVMEQPTRTFDSWADVDALGWDAAS